jgi:hypothetical protein
LSPLCGFICHGDQGQELSGTVSFIWVLLGGPLLNELLGGSLEHGRDRWSLSTVRSSAWISSITIPKPISEESPDSFIIGCPLWPLFFVFLGDPMTSGSVSVSLTTPGSLTRDVSLPGLRAWIFVSLEAWLGFLSSSSFLSCFRTCVPCVPVLHRTLHTPSLSGISQGMAARSRSYTKSTRAALAFS